MEIGQVLVRYPKAHRSEAELAVQTLHDLIPVVESYLAAKWEGKLRLELLQDARASGVNPAMGMIRHALRGFEESSPRTAGLLSYQLGKILWYRASKEADYTGQEARSPDWLTEAALLPLLHLWSTRNEWLDYLAEQVSVLKKHRRLSSKRLETFSELSPSEQLLASAESLLRGQSLSKREPKWIVRLCQYLANNPQAHGLEGLERISSPSLGLWETHFETDIAAWLSETDFT